MDSIGVKLAYPGFIEPCLASAVDKVPSGQRWIHEIKFDGYRVQLHCWDGECRVFTRRGIDWTKRFRRVAVDASALKARSAIIDGEVVVAAADGTTDFAALQRELRGRSDKLVLVAFDLLYLNGRDLRKEPLRARKELLHGLIDGSRIQFSDSFEEEGRVLYSRACKAGLEGIVSKVADSRYTSGRGCCPYSTPGVLIHG